MQIRQGLTVGLVIIIIQLFLLISADYVFGELATKAEKILTLYILIQVAVYPALGYPSFYAEKITGKAFVSFLLMFFLTVITATFFRSTGILGLMASLDPLKAVFGFGFIYVFQKVATEEGIFRDVFPRYIGYFWSNVLFAVFHTAMLTALFNPTALQLFLGVGLLFVLGSIWGYIAQRQGTVSAIGSHAGWNSVAGKLLGV